MRAWPGGIGGIATDRVAGCWASAFIAANRTSAAAANGNRRGKIFRFVGINDTPSIALHEMRVFHASCCGAVLLKTSSMLRDCADRSNARSVYSFRRLPNDQKR